MDKLWNAFTTKWFGFDPGNSVVKNGVLGYFNHESMFPQAVNDMDPDDYELKKVDFEQAIMKDNSYMFKYGKKCYMVGAEALKNGIQKVGPAKYEAEHFMPLLLAALQSKYPKGETGLNVWVTHPFNAHSVQLNTLSKVIIGKHTITYANGMKATFEIDEVKLIPEARAAASAGMITQEGKWRVKNDNFSLVSGDALIFDGGSVFSAFMPIRLERLGATDTRFKAEYFTSNGIPVEYGSSNVYDHISRNLINRVPQFSRMTSVPTEIIYTLLTEAKLMHRGVDLLADKDSGVKNSDIFGSSGAVVTSATNRFMAEIEAAYAKFDYGAKFQLIMISGGAGRALMPWIKKVLNHENCGGVLNNDRMIYSTIHGMSCLYMVMRGLGKA